MLHAHRRARKALSMRCVCAGLDHESVCNSVSLCLNQVVEAEAEAQEAEAGLFARLKSFLFLFY